MELERPRTREKRPRSHSAKARLTPAPPPRPPHGSHKNGGIVEERIKSAKAIRDQHTSSAAVLACPPSKSAGLKRFTSMYSKDFDGTFVPPAEIRPTSPTRRNNPHPGKVGLERRGWGSLL